MVVGMSDRTIFITMLLRVAVIRRCVLALGVEVLATVLRLRAESASTIV